MNQPQSLKEIERLYIQGERDLHRGNLATAIAIFEQLLDVVEPAERLYFDVQTEFDKSLSAK